MEGLGENGAASPDGINSAGQGGALIHCPQIDPPVGFRCNVEVMFLPVLSVKWFQE